MAVCLPRRRQDPQDACIRPGRYAKASCSAAPTPRRRPARHRAAPSSPASGLPAWNRAAISGARCRPSSMSIPTCWSAPATGSALRARVGARATSARAAARVIPRGPSTTSARVRRPPRGFTTSTTPRNFADFLAQALRRPAVLFLVWRARAASSVRTRHRTARGQAAGRRASCRAACRIRPKCAATCSTMRSKSNGSTPTWGACCACWSEAGELDNTIVAVTGDNGLPFPRCQGESLRQRHPRPAGRALGRQGTRAAARWTTSSACRTSRPRSCRRWDSNRPPR